MFAVGGSTIDSRQCSVEMQRTAVRHWLSSRSNYSYHIKRLLKTFVHYDKQLYWYLIVLTYSMVCRAAVLPICSHRICHLNRLVVVFLFSWVCVLSSSFDCLWVRQARCIGFTWQQLLSVLFDCVLYEQYPLFVTRVKPLNKRLVGRWE